MTCTRNVWTLDTVRNRCTEEGACWLWAQSLNSGGYPQASINGKNTRVQRFVFTELCGGVLPRGFVIAYRCRNRLCCAPDCLEAITYGERAKRCYSEGNRNTATEYRARQEKAIAQGWATKLNPQKAAAIRQRGNETAAALAAEYDVHPKTIAGVRAGRYWRDGVRGSSAFNQ